MKVLLTFFAITLFSYQLFAQSPNKMSFQAIVRDANGSLVSNSQVGVQISIIQNTGSGTLVYREVHSIQANANGLVTLEIGTGTNTFGNFTTINWGNGPYFLKTETDPTGGFSFTVSSTSQLMSVPYSLYSKFADAANETDPIFNTSVASTINTTDITNWNNKLDVELDGDSTNEIQSLSLSNDTLFLTNGGFVILPLGFDGQYSSLTGTPTNVSAFTNDAGYLTTEIDGSVTNEIQALSMSNDTIYLSNGGFVKLPAGFDGQYSSLTGTPTNVSAFNNDAGYISFEVDGSITNEIQALTISNDTLFLSSGGFVVLPAGFDGQYSSLTGAPTNISFFNNDTGYLTSFNEIDGDSTNEIQAISISNDTIYLSDGGFALLPVAVEVDGDTTNELQTLTVSNDTLFLSSGGFAVLPASAINFDNDSTNEIQALSISNDTLYLTNGGYAILPSSSTEWSKTGNAGTISGSSFIGTTDNQNLDFRTNNSIRMRLTNQGQLEFLNTGNSVFIGENAGANDNLTNNWNVFIGKNAGMTSSSGSVNVAIGGEAFKSNTSGNFSTAIGYQSQEANTTGSFNTSIGYQTLWSNTFGARNIAVGCQALKTNINGNNNIAIGYSALSSSTTSYGIIAIGFKTLENNITGSDNSAIGHLSMTDNTSGNENTAFGSQTLSKNTTGSNNTSIGSRALFYNTSGHNNTSIGNYSLYYNTTGYKNTSIGNYSLYYNTTGFENTATGFYSLLKNTSGKWNTANGAYSLNNNTTGFRNTANGWASLYSNTTGINRTGVGCSANSVGTDYYNSTGIGNDADPTAANKVRIGNSSVTEIGGQVGWSTLSDKRFKTNVRQDEVKGLEFITRLQPITYNYDIDAYAKWKESQYGELDTTEWRGKYAIEQIRFSGFMAQDVEKIAREINYNFSGVCKPASDKDTYSIRYAEFVVPMVKAIQEQQEIIETQEKTIELLNKRLEALEAVVGN